MADRGKLIDLMIEAKKADTEVVPFSEFLADFLFASGCVKIVDLDGQQEADYILDYSLCEHIQKKGGDWCKNHSVCHECLEEWLNSTVK